MIKIIDKIKFWLNCARVYSLPVTVLSWIVIYVYSLKNGGNWILGLVALLGISLVHMATNLADDFFDYKLLSKDEQYIDSAQNCKCWYLKNGQATLTDLKKAIITFLGLGAIIGILLFFLSGKYVFLLCVLGLLVAIFYQRMSIMGLGDVAVIFAYGPLLFEGVYYVMCKTFSIEVLILSLMCSFFTNSLLYAHMLMDFDGDVCSRKKTLCTVLKTKERACDFILVFYIGGYILSGLLTYVTKNYYYLLTYLTLPLVIDLYNSLKLYNIDKTKLPEEKLWHYPLENWKECKKTKDAPFYFRFFFARNIITWYMLLTCIAIICD